MEVLVILGSIITFIGIVPYVRDTIKGQTKPNRVTWLLWGISPTIAAVAAFSDGAGWSAVPILISGLMCILILIASFINPKSYWELKRFDYICGALSVLALILWGITKEADIAILLSIGSDALAAIPTLRKAIIDPNSETITPYLVGIFNASTGVLVSTDWAFSKIGFNIYLVLINLLLSVAIIFGARKLKAKEVNSNS